MALFAFLHVLLIPCLWVLINAALRHDIAVYSREFVSHDTIENGQAWVELQRLAGDMRTISSAWSGYLQPCVASCVLGMFFAVLCAVSRSGGSNGAWVVMALTESGVLLAVLLSGGLSTTAFAHEPLRAAHALVADTKSVIIGTSEADAVRGSAVAIREYIMHAQAASKVEGISVLPGHSRCTANSAIALWLGLQLIILALAKVWTPDGTEASSDLQ
jgi:hypothetical protein